jgi:anti-anti-sigma factor
MRNAGSGVQGGSPGSDAFGLAVFGDVPRGRVVIVGELDLLTAPRLEHLLTKLFDAGYRQLGVDASGVEFFAAAGMNVLVRAGGRFREAGGQLQLLALSSPVQRVLTIARLDAALNLVHPDGNKLKTAMAARQNGADPARRAAPSGATASREASRSPEPQSCLPDPGRS